MEYLLDTNICIYIIKKKPINVFEKFGPLDTLIAAHAISLDLILVTNNEREFERIAGLRIENWAK